MLMGLGDSGDVTPGEVAAQNTGFSPSTPCQVIADDSPYRMPGNQCMGPNGVMTFDATGHSVYVLAVPWYSNPTYWLVGIAAAVGGYMLWHRSRA